MFNNVYGNKVIKQSNSYAFFISSNELILLLLSFMKDTSIKLFQILLSKCGLSNKEFF